MNKLNPRKQEQRKYNSVKKPIIKDSVNDKTKYPSHDNLSSLKKRCVQQTPLYGTSIHYSEKHHAIHQLKSAERDYAVLLDWSEDVISYSSHVTCDANIGGVTITQKFSFMVQYSDHQCLVDIGSSLSKRFTDRRFSRKLGNIAAQNKAKYQFITSESLQGPLLRNVMRLRSALKKPRPDNDFREFCRNALQQSASVLEAQEQLSIQGKNPDLITQFIAHGLVKGNLNTPWSEMNITWEVA